MIENDTQYAITLHWAERFEMDADDLEAGRPLSPGVAPYFRLVLIEAARSEARILRKQLKDYRQRTGGHDPGDEDEP